MDRKSLLWILAGALIFLVACGTLIARLASGPGERLLTSFQPTATPTPVPDSDGDGADDTIDNCADLANPSQHDIDDDGRGDACDLDIDGDDVGNPSDACPFNRLDDCLEPEPVTVNIINPTAFQDLKSARVATIGLTTFANPDASLPLLLNGVVYPAGDQPLWDGAGDLNLTLTFTSQKDAPTWPSVNGDLSLSGGTLTCPSGADGGGLCRGHLMLEVDPSADGVAPECDDALCAWSMDAAFGADGILNVWGGYDAETNQLRFATGLPAFLEDTLQTRYTVELSPGDAPAIQFESTHPGLKLPVTVPDPEGDCTDSNGDAAECVPFVDLQSVVMQPQLVDGLPFLKMDIQAGAEFPTDRRQAFPVIDVFTVLLELPEDGPTFGFRVFSMFPERDGEWGVGVFDQGPTGEFVQVDDPPPGLSVSAEGAVVTLHMPVSTESPWTNGVLLISSRAFGGNSQSIDSEDGLRSLGSPAPLAVFYHGMDDAAGQPPLVGFSLHNEFHDRFHGFAVMPFPGSPLAPRVRGHLAAPAGDAFDDELPDVDCGNVQAALLDLFLFWYENFCGVSQFDVDGSLFGVPHRLFDYETAEGKVPPPDDPTEPRPPFDGESPLDGPMPPREEPTVPLLPEDELPWWDIPLWCLLCLCSLLGAGLVGGGLWAGRRRLRVPPIDEGPRVTSPPCGCECKVGVTGPDAFGVCECTVLTYKLVPQLTGMGSPVVLLRAELDDGRTMFEREYKAVFEPKCWGEAQPVADEFGVTSRFQWWHNQPSVDVLEIGVVATMTVQCPGQPPVEVTCRSEPFRIRLHPSPCVVKVIVIHGSFYEVCHMAMQITCGEYDEIFGYAPFGGSVLSTFAGTPGAVFFEGNSSGINDGIGENYSRYNPKYDKSIWIIDVECKHCDALRRNWEALAKAPGEYNLFNNNCSTTVMDMLKHQGIIDEKWEDAFVGGRAYRPGLAGDVLDKLAGLGIPGPTGVVVQPRIVVPGK